MKLVTIRKKFGKHKVKLTQGYNEKSDFGHYKGVIENAKGDILHTYSTCCGAPEGKINEATLEEVYNQWKRWA